MVLPGIQALFGFQLVAVFNSAFRERLTAGEQRIHLLAILCVVTAVALVMAPAALHRQAEPDSISEAFLRLASRLMMWGMMPLALGTALDVYLVARVILDDRMTATVVAAASLLIFAALWVMLPMRFARRVR